MMLGRSGLLLLLVAILVATTLGEIIPEASRHDLAWALLAVGSVGGCLCWVSLVQEGLWSYRDYREWLELEKELASQREEQSEEEL